MRGARRYSTRMEVWASTPSPDGYGGNVLTEALQKKLWAEVVSLSSEKATQNGIERGVEAYELNVRKDPDVDWTDDTLFVKINGNSYRILRLEDVDLKGVEMNIVISS